MDFLVVAPRLVIPRLELWFLRWALGFGTRSGMMGWTGLQMVDDAKYRNECKEVPAEDL
jgi:hypothetical protein